MTEEHKTNETNASQPFSRLPWLIALGALALYTITLNHWVTMTSLANVARIVGWDWHPAWIDWRPNAFTPLYFLISAPCRLVPAAWQPIALNALSALCAALTLMLLARSVALLPHDRSRDQRLRELPHNGLLQGSHTAVPQILAVLACGLQRTFWEHATTATTEMLDLLVFAALIWCLLEFRHSKRGVWLTRFVLLYGIGVTNNWALLGFFPFFLISVIWIKGLEFFEWKFIGKLAGWFSLGLLLYLLLPAINAATGGANFWHDLRLELSSEKSTLFYVPGWVALLLALPTLPALCFIGIRWPSFQGDMSAFGSAISNAGFRLMHLIFFVASLWLFLDIRYSPRVFFEVVPFLTFYYMAALSVGYFAGYFLFVLTTNPAAAWAKRSGAEQLIAQVSLVVLAAGAFAVPGWLAYTNGPKIQAANRQLLKDYAVALAQSLPPNAVVLSDDHSRLFMVKAACQALNKKTDNVFIETDSLVYGQYLTYLANTYPQIQSAIGPVTNLPPVIDSLSTLHLLGLFNEKSKLPIYYLHPSFGFFFEQYYAKPHGLVSELLPYATNQFDPPALTSAEIEQNQETWKKLDASFLGAVPKALKLTTDAEAVGWYCSRSANNWGIELQEANRLKEARDFFDFALKLNPHNHMAIVNQRYNRNLQEKNTHEIDTTEIVHDAMLQCRTWEGVINSDGLADEPGLQLRFGQALAAGGNLRQAYLFFERRLSLCPDDFEAELAMAKTYADMGMPEKALAMVRKAELKAASPADKAELLRIEALSMVVKGNWADAETFLVNAHKQSPQDDRRVQLLVEYYRLAGVTMLRQQKTDQANQQFRKALSAIDAHLTILNALGRSAGQDELDNALLKKAELQSQLGDYNDAIATLGVLIKRQPKSSSALVSRAFALLKSKKYAEAKEDYLSLQRSLPSKAPAVYYGLGEIAFQTNDKKEAIKNFRTFLELSPAGSPEYKQISERVAKLESGH